MKKVYFVKHNHGSEKPIKDFVETFAGMFEDVNFEFSNKIVPNEKNLILDEFTRFNFVEELIKTKNEYPDTKIYLIFTEYITHNCTYNYFGENIHFLKLRNFFYDLIYSGAKKINYIERAEINGINQRAFLKKIFLLFDTLYLNIKKIIRVCYNIFLGDSLYMHFRFKGYCKIKHLIDCHLVWNNNQKDQLNKFHGKKIRILNFLPQIKKIRKTNDIGISISGIKTSFRISLVKKLLKKIKVKNNFEEYILSKGFLFKGNFYTYSFNPSKSKNWKYPSLIRYAFSIQNNEIPLIIEDFSDEFTENASIYTTLESIENGSIFNNENILNNFNLMNKKIERYNDIYNSSKIEFKSLINE